MRHRACNESTPFVVPSDWASRTLRVGNAAKGVGNINCPRGPLGNWLSCEFSSKNERAGGDGLAPGAV